jgi:galactose mutarotase-like enzyme
MIGMKQIEKLDKNKIGYIPIEPVVQMICFECWKHLDDDMEHPNWNMMEWK